MTKHKGGLILTTVHLNYPTQTTLDTKTVASFEEVIYPV